MCHPCTSALERYEKLRLSTLKNIDNAIDVLINGDHCKISNQGSKLEMKMKQMLKSGLVGAMPYQCQHYLILIMRRMLL